MALVGSPMPSREPLIEQDRSINFRWLLWFQRLRQEQDSTPVVQTDVVALTAQTAAIGTTAIQAPSLSAGYYRVSTYARITTAAGVSGSVTVTIHYTSGGVSCSEPGTTVANATNVPQSDTFLIKVDGATPVSYSVAYASNPAATVAYELAVVLERVSA
jgi:hypothetical protein